MLFLNKLLNIFFSFSVSHYLGRPIVTSIKAFLSSPIIIVRGPEKVLRTALLVKWHFDPQVLRVKASCGQRSIYLQIGELCEGFLTARMCTFVWSITGVDSAWDKKRRKGRDVSKATWRLAQQASSRSLLPSHRSGSVRWVSRRPRLLLHRSRCIT